MTSRAAWLVGSFLFLAIFLSFPVQANANPPVTIVQKTPIEALSAQGDITSVSEAPTGAQFSLISADGDQLTVQDAQGIHYRVRLSATDYVVPATPSNATPSPAAADPPASSLSTAHSTNAPDLTPVPAPPPSVATAPDTAAPDASDNSIAGINTGLGKPIFTKAPFWSESALLIASRLALKLEDRTKWEASYRLYFYDRTGQYAPASILGGAAYCIALYADANDNPTSLLIAYTNDGDYADVGPDANEIYRAQDPTFQVTGHRKAFEPLRAGEQAVIAKNLTALFGEPKNVSFGSDAATREDSQRWDWNGVSFLLTGQKDHYNLLRIIPTSLADANGRTERINRDELGAKLSSAVEHRPNGDVVITQLPMADQGQKGYCVPATWERVLRYTGVPGDMYTLSRIGGAGFGGGENGGTLAGQLDDTLHNYGRRAEPITMSKIDSLAVHRYIDQGIPIFWGVNPTGYESVEKRYALCDRDKDWDEWKKLLTQFRSDPDKGKLAPMIEYSGHQVLITGYNPETHEIAWSDPWGRQTSERWMTEEEAQRCSLGEYYIITW